jgi:hypothetical protein
MPNSDAASFGRRRYVAETTPGALRQIDARERRIEPETAAESFTNPISRLLNGLFLWLPNERSPGFGEVCLAILRQAALPFAFMVTPALAYMLVFNKIPTPSKISITPSIQLVDFLVFIAGFFALVQELSRYSFVRRADNPSRSLIIFGIVSIICIVLIHHDSPYTMGWMMMAQIAASFAMLATRRYWATRGLIVAAVVVFQTALAVGMPLLGPHDAAATTAAPVPTTASRVAPPHIGDMEAWARLYPDASVQTNDTSDMFGITSWRVQYTTGASADQIASFYDGIASQYGFKADPSVLGVHNYSREHFREQLGYQTLQAGGALHVFLTARTANNK